MNLKLRGPLHYFHKQYGATWMEDNGWELPQYYNLEEGKSASLKLIIGDETSIGKFLIQGRGLDNFFTMKGWDVIPEVGKILEIYQGILAPSHLYRLTMDKIMLLTPLNHRQAINEIFTSEKNILCCHSLDISSGYASLVIASTPDKIFSLLSKLLSIDLESISSDSCITTGMAGLPVILGCHKKGIRILVGREDAEDCWNLLMNAQDENKIVPIGWKITQELLWD